MSSAGLFRAWCIGLAVLFGVSAFVVLFAPHVIVEGFRGSGAPIGQLYITSESSHLWRASAAGGYWISATLCALMARAPRDASQLLAAFVSLHVFEGTAFALIWAIGKFMPYAMTGAAFAPLLVLAASAYGVVIVTVALWLRARA